jgi:hypothetical protein
VSKLLFACLIASAAIGPAGAAQHDQTWTSFDEADARLSAAYKAAMAVLEPRKRSALRQEERDWIMGRNAACGFEAKNDCATRRTWDRVRAVEGVMARTTVSPSMSDNQLLALERRLDDACRGASQDADGAICRRRDVVVTRLQGRGWCWGPDHAIEADRRWMKRGSNCRA